MNIPEKNLGIINEYLDATPKGAIDPSRPWAHDLVPLEQVLFVCRQRCHQLDWTMYFYHCHKGYKWNFGKAISFLQGAIDKSGYPTTPLACIEDVTRRALIKIPVGTPPDGRNNNGGKK